ncbi:LytR/AlgR family response regulator transcription factor [Saccharicrinis fermentans]|uniref:Sensory transduction protein LytR n=1 Tax=Saccharicrinis fermentans DSM 9555 = JCM 21142 TaxID=869213 RepID=W7Y9F1_9BACT|nr:LytTR family DNA-binding domain-containing protein [Saccharicrinis fermentans]GAF04123.1 sensory transduction protein LytR [Saccharicrinis fermentans DSM 9555 = JCM 21142]
MQVLIVEDEPLAATHLTLLIKECDQDVEVLDVLDSVDGAEAWLKSNSHPPLIFMDVHLGDGICFEIFKRVPISSFIIFTTAYDQYALQAFKVNSVDYLLKPLTRENVSDALMKYQKFSKKKDDLVLKPDISKLLDTIQNIPSQYKERFVVKVGAHIRPVYTKEIACFYSHEKASYLLTQTGRNYLIDFALDKLQDMLDPKKFFRISRKYIVSLSAIEDVIVQGPSRLKIKIVAGTNEGVMVSRERIKEFKCWLEG